MIADIDTIDRARDGDGEALSTLWTIYQPMILRLLRARRAEAPDDVASQVWLEVGRSIGRFEGDGDGFRRWIFTIAVRRAADDAGRRCRRTEVPTETFDEDPTAPGVEAQFDASGALDRAVAMLGQLKPATAEVVMLRVVLELPIAEVAEVTGRSEGGVRTLVHRGLAQLRQLVGPGGVILAEGSTPVST